MTDPWAAPANRTDPWAAPAIQAPPVTPPLATDAGSAATAGFGNDWGNGDDRVQSSPSGLIASVNANGSAEPTKVGRRFGKSTFIVGISVAVLTLGYFLAGLSESLLVGIGTALGADSFFGFLTGLYVAASGRPSWARLKGGRRTGIILLLASFIAAIVAFALVGIGSPTETHAWVPRIEVTTPPAG